jgi:hypothetical protein
MLENMCAVVFTIGVAGGLAISPVLTHSVQSERLNPQIGKANPKAYKSIRYSRDWKNPYLVFRPEGIEVIAQGLPSGRQTVAATDLRRTLLALQVSAWPYGRVVAVQDPSIRVGGLSEGKSIADNRNSALATLKKLDVIVDDWPP